MKWIPPWRQILIPCAECEKRVAGRTLRVVDGRSVCTRCATAKPEPEDPGPEEQDRLFEDPVAA